MRYVSQIESRQDEVIFKLVNDHVFTSVYIKKFVPNKERLMNEIMQTNNDLVVTEGCTDWKHLKSALIHFNKNNKYKNLNFEFVEYEDSLSENKNLSGNKTLESICEYVSLFKNDYRRIFVFDADDKQINEKYSNEKGYKYLGNNVYVVVLPVPEFRKDTPLISIENYYTDTEIKTKDAQDRRLYMSHEFYIDNLHNGEGLYTLKSDPKRPNLVIDDMVFTIKNDEKIKNKSDLNEKKNNLRKAPILSKNNFAKNILNEVQPFDSFSKDNFSLFFDLLEGILKTNYEDKLNLEDEVYISANTKIQIYSDHYEMHIQVWEEKDNGIINLFRESSIKSYALDFVDNKVYIGFGYCCDECLIIARLEHSQLLEKFIEAKINNSFNNRVYVNMFDNKKNYVCTFEILGGNDGEMEFAHLVRKIESMINS